MRSKDTDKLMYNLGRIKEYQPDHGFGFVTVQDNNEIVFFEISDFPSEGGLPRKGENVKFIIVQNQGKLKASQFIRLDQALKYSFKMPSSKARSWHDPVQENRSKARKVFAWVSILVMGILAGGYYGWKTFQEYQAEQSFKLNLYTQQQNDIVIEQRKAVGHVKQVHFSEESRAALNETTSTQTKTEQMTVKVIDVSKEKNEQALKKSEQKERPAADVRVTSDLIKRSDMIDESSNQH